MFLWSIVTLDNTHTHTHTHIYVSIDYRDTRDNTHTHTHTRTHTYVSMNYLSWHKTTLQRAQSPVTLPHCTCGTLKMGDIEHVRCGHDGQFRVAYHQDYTSLSLLCHSLSLLSHSLSLYLPWHTTTLEDIYVSIVSLLNTCMSLLSNYRDTPRHLGNLQGLIKVAHVSLTPFHMFL